MLDKDKAQKQVRFAGEAVLHVWIWINGQHADPTVDGMLVVGLLKCERIHVGMQKQVPMCIASVDGRWYDSELSDTDEVSSVSLSFSRSRNVGRYCYVNGTTTS